MAEASRRAAGPARKGGRPNARFVVAAAEAPPVALIGVAELVTVVFPWGSLLRGVVGLDEAVASGVARLVAPGGSLELLLAPSRRDGLEEVAGWATDTHELAHGVARAFDRHGLQVVIARAATDEDIGASGSTWAKRLLSTGSGGRNGRSPRDRSVVVLRLVRS